MNNGVSGTWRRLFAKPSLAIEIGDFPGNARHSRWIERERMWSVLFTLTNTRLVGLPLQHNSAPANRTYRAQFLNNKSTVFVFPDSPVTEKALKDAGL